MPKTGIEQNTKGTKKTGDETTRRRFDILTTNTNNYQVAADNNVAKSVTK